MNRYKVVALTDRVFAAFAAKVVDSDAKDGFSDQPICLCYTMSDAELICKALNYSIRCGVTNDA